MLAGLTTIVKARDEVMTTALLYVCSITSMFNIKGRFLPAEGAREAHPLNLDVVRLTPVHSLRIVRNVKLRM